MSSDDRNSHDVEDAAGVDVFGVRQFIVAPAFVIGRLDVLVNLPAIRAFEVEPIFSMCFDGGADRWIGDLAAQALGEFPDIRCEVVELGLVERESHSSISSTRRARPRTYR